ncbi:MAG: hypothetical protein VX617_03290, partial [Pseudomonadota bacterium]|nr:hypothetical protein [Pseudomonadota bacterium]
LGISFHVGSQQTDITAWEKAIKKAGVIESELINYQINLRVINIGGGFPVAYQVSVPEIEEIASLIQAYVSKHLSKNCQTILVEPGRYIAASAGVLRSQVVMVSKKSHYSKKRWVYLDVGTFGGLIETLNEVIQYPLRTSKDHEKGGPVVIAGPTCDGADVMYSNTSCILPLSLTSGDYVDILGTGAYTTSYASKCFNGFEGPSEFYL